MFSIKFSGGAVASKFNLMIDNVKHLDEALKQFSKYLRDKTKRAFAQEGPGWPGLAQSTDKKLLHSFAGQFRADGKLKKATETRMRAALARDIKKGKVPQGAMAKFNAAIAGRLSGNAAVAMLGHQARKKKLKEMSAAEKLQDKLQKLSDMSHSARVEKLGKNRAIKNHKMLGKLASSISATIKGSTLKVFSKVDWAGVHNDGGMGGHNARIPQRQFLSLDEADLKVLATMVEGQLIGS